MALLHYWSPLITEIIMFDLLLFCKEHVESRVRASLPLSTVSSDLMPVSGKTRMDKKKQGPDYPVAHASMKIDISVILIKSD